MNSPDIVVGDDGRPRCGWTGADPDYQRYHDDEWGVPLHGDRALFEKISLEGFQAGLSWITILHRRAGFRAAFHGFDIDTVAAYTDEDVERLLRDERIIRNRSKVLAAIGNARVTADLVREKPGALDHLIWSFAPADARIPRHSRTDIPAVTPESEALSAALRTAGFRFVGPTTMYALMQSAGLVDDHLADCWRSATETTR